MYQILKTVQVGGHGTNSAVRRPAYLCNLLDNHFHRVCTPHTRRRMKRRPSGLPVSALQQPELLTWEIARPEHSTDLC
jgi:hypothetical protein